MEKFPGLSHGGIKIFPPFIESIAVTEFVQIMFPQLQHVRVKPFSELGKECFIIGSDGSV